MEIAPDWVMVARTLAPSTARSHLAVKVRAPILAERYRLRDIMKRGAIIRKAITHVLTRSCVVTCLVACGGETGAAERDLVAADAGAGMLAIGEPGATDPAPGEEAPGEEAPSAEAPTPEPSIEPESTLPDEAEPSDEPAESTAPVPAPEPGPAASEGGYVVDGACMPECAQDDSDPDGDGWGWENEASCVVAGSGAAAGRTRCEPENGTEPADPAGPTTPTPSEPALPPAVGGDAQRPDSVSSSGFFVSNGRLYDANGNDFVIRGINHGHYWFRNELDTAFGAIANTGANTIRIVWESEGTAGELETAVQRAIDLELIPMVELHDVTGSNSQSDLLNMARYYTGAQVLAVLQRFERHLLVNIANEWSGEDWLGGYQAAVAEMRDAGINHTLVIDANGWGQESATVLRDGQALLDSDPERNLLFSVHMYQSFGSDSAITAALQGAVDQGLPLIVGEFGFQHGTPVTQIPYETILSECARLGLGYIPWSWKGNSSEVAYLDMSEDWGGNTLTDWGRGVVEGSQGIASTSQKASVFLLDM